MNENKQAGDALCALRKRVMLLALACASGVALADAVLYMHEQSESNKSTVSYNTPNYAFADKISNSLSVAVWVKDRIGPGDRDKFIAGVPGCWQLSIPNGISRVTDSRCRKGAIASRCM